MVSRSRRSIRSNLSGLSSLLDQEAEALADEEDEVADEEFTRSTTEEMVTNENDDLDEFDDDDDSIEALSEDEEVRTNRFC